MSKREVLILVNLMVAGWALGMGINGDSLWPWSMLIDGPSSAFLATGVLVFMSLIAWKSPT